MLTFLPSQLLQPSETGVCLKLLLTLWHRLGWVLPSCCLFLDTPENDFLISLAVMLGPFEF